ncbi:MAG: DUF4199 domain-containing protein [Salegentibacter sp.]
MKKFTIPIKYGIAIAVGLIAYFLILSLFGLHTNPLYSIFNVVIMAVGMYLALKDYRRGKKAKFKYQKGFMATLLTGANATIIFTIFFGIYCTELNPGFLDNLIKMWASYYGTGLGVVIFSVAAMGFSTSLVLSLAYMQIFKDSWNTKEGREHTF